MTVVPGTETHDRPLTLSLPALAKNSPLLYGLGSFGLESAYGVLFLLADERLCRGDAALLCGRGTG